MTRPFPALIAAGCLLCSGIADAQPRDPLPQVRDLLGRGQTAEALRLLEREAKARPNDSAVRNMLASLLNREGIYPRALLHAEAAVRLRPENASYRANYGIVLAEHGRFREAIDAFNRALSRDPTLIYAHLERGAAWLSLDDTERARADWQAARKIDGKLVWPIWYEATGHFVEGRFAEAAAAFDRVAAAEPGFAAARLWSRLSQARDGRRAVSPVSPGEGWPLRLLDLFEGRAPLKTILAEAERDRLSGDRRRAGEALFVAAQKEIMRGERKAAADLLRKAVAIRAPRHVWKIAAERDLKLLTSP